jgi:hypothetical protein
MTEIDRMRPEPGPDTGIDDIEADIGIVVWRRRR